MRKVTREGSNFPQTEIWRPPFALKCPLPRPAGQAFGEHGRHALPAWRLCRQNDHCLAISTAWSRNTATRFESLSSSA